MSQETSTRGRPYSVLRLVVCLSLSCFLILYLTREYSLAELLAGLEGFDWALAVAGLLVQGISIFTQGLRWRILFPQFSLAMATAGTVVALGANAAIPARGGEVVRCLFFSRKSHLTVPQALLCVALERTLDATSLCCFGWFSLLALSGKLDADGTRLSLALLSLLALAMGGIFLLVRATHHRWSVLPDGQTGQNWKLTLARFMVRTTTALRHVSAPRLVSSVALTVAIVLMEALVLLLLLSGTGIPLGFMTSLAIYPLVALAISVPVSVGYIGVFHAALVYSLALKGLSGPEVVSAAFVVHLLTVVPPVAYAVAIGAWSFPTGKQDLDAT